VIIKSFIKPQDREKFFIRFGGIAQLCFVAAIFLGRMEDPRLDFITGLLMGFSMVGNLVFVYNVSRKVNKQRRLK
jgi:hypothetical protein